ncbi:TonB-dependent receptor [Chryseobacterium salivictor]|uniref:Putative TonB-dependent receptor n=1 Tax=Chryseobacterium salivictor TaxID=2547600 RepID=A0A4V1AL53_9FLAO|nr:TonB-dependent receptor [Chryseobacterium salivictor]QBO58564.1 putative TonB-dependent receptor [Chryseobacterium salivictor]
MKFTLNIITIFFGLLFINAQTNFTVKGKVVDYHDKTSLKNATVTIGKRSQVSDDNGNFTFKTVQKGKYTLIVNHPDCNPFTEGLTVNKDMELTIQLEHHIADIETITLHATHKNANSLIVKTLDRTEIDRNSTENLGNILSGISGVGALKTGNNIAKPIIHGLYGSRVPIINNGVKMAEQEWGVEHAPNIDVNQFDHVDVIKGASALKYGSDAIGGVVVLEPAVYKRKDTIQGSANLSGISNGRGIGVAVNLLKTWENGWAVKSTGGFKKLGDLKTPGYYLMNTGLQNNSFSLTVQKNSFLQGISFDYSITNQEIGIYRGSDLGNLEDFYKALTTDIPIYQRDFSYAIDNPKQNVQHHIAKISAFKRFEKLGKVSVDYNFQYNHRKEYDVRRGELAQIPSLDLELFTNQFNINDFIERQHWSLETGIDLKYQFNYSTPETQARRLVPNYDQYAGGVYSVFKYKLTPKLNAEVGVRYDVTKYEVKKWYDLSNWENLYADTFPQFYVKTDGNRVFTKPNLTYKNLSFNAGLDYQPSKNFDVKLNYAKVGRTPNIAELFADGLHHSAAIIEVGNMGMKNEDGNQFNLNIDGKLNILDGARITVNPYLFITKNFITEIPTGIQNTIRGVFPVWSYQQINAKMYGLDVDAQLKLNDHFEYHGNFSYINGEDQTNGQPLIMMVPTNFANSLEFKNEEWKNFYFKVQQQTFLHQNRFPVYNPTIHIFENGIEVEKTLDLSTPPPTYTLWSVQTGFDFNKHFSAGLNVTNLFDTNYKDYLNRMRYFSYEMGRNIIFNVKYNF